MFKTILAPLTGSDCDLSVLQTSLGVLSGGKGHIQCLRLNPDPAALIAQAAQVDMGGWMIVSDTVTAIEKEAKERTASARANLERFTRQENIPIADRPGADGVSIAWREETGDEFDQITDHARYHDVVVLAGGPDRPGRMPDEALGGIIFGSGRPVILVPQQQTGAPSLNRVALAWKNVPEAARAITAAMPLLRRAKHIDVFSANESDEAAHECLSCADNIIRYLDWHGFDASSHFVIPAGRSPADAVLDSAREAGAGLLVMGAYGHSRIREFVFGGFTQRVLKGAELPVLLFH